MSQNELEILWETMERLLLAVEGPQGHDQGIGLALRACVEQIVAQPPDEVVAQARRSPLPARPLLSWLVFEASRQGGELARRGQALKERWEAGGLPGESIMNPAPCRAVA